MASNGEAARNARFDELCARLGTGPETADRAWSLWLRSSRYLCADDLGDLSPWFACVLYIAGSLLLHPCSTHEVTSDRGLGAHLACGACCEALAVGFLLRKFCCFKYARVFTLRFPLLARPLCAPVVRAHQTYRYFPIIYVLASKPCHLDPQAWDLTACRHFGLEVFRDFLMSALFLHDTQTTHNMASTASHRHQPTPSYRTFRAYPCQVYCIARGSPRCDFLSG